MKLSHRPGERKMKLRDSPPIFSGVKEINLISQHNRTIFISLCLFSDQSLAFLDQLLGVAIESSPIRSSLLAQTNLWKMFEPNGIHFVGWKVFVGLDSHSKIILRNCLLMFPRCFFIGTHLRSPKLTRLLFGE